MKQTVRRVKREPGVRNPKEADLSLVKIENGSSEITKRKSNHEHYEKNSKKVGKWYRQKYKKNWESAKEFAGWLAPSPADPNSAYCLACAKVLRGGMTHLKRHADTPYHKTRMNQTKKVSTFE